VEAAVGRFLEVETHARGDGGTVLLLPQVEAREPSLRLNEIALLQCKFWPFYLSMPLCLNGENVKVVKVNEL